MRVPYKMKRRAIVDRSSRNMSLSTKLMTNTGRMLASKGRGSRHGPSHLEVAWWGEVRGRFGGVLLPVRLRPARGATVLGRGVVVDGKER